MICQKMSQLANQFNELWPRICLRSQWPLSNKTWSDNPQEQVDMDQQTYLTDLRKVKTQTTGHNKNRKACLSIVTVTHTQHRNVAWLALKLTCLHHLVFIVFGWGWGTSITPTCEYSKKADHSTLVSFYSCRLHPSPLQVSPTSNSDFCNFPWTIIVDDIKNELKQMQIVGERLQAQ